MRHGAKEQQQSERSQRDKGQCENGTRDSEPSWKLFQHGTVAERAGSGTPGQWCPIVNWDAIPALPAAGWFGLVLSVVVVILLVAVTSEEGNTHRKCLDTSVSLRRRGQLWERAVLPVLVKSRKLWTAAP